MNKPNAQLLLNFAAFLAGHNKIAQARKMLEIVFKIDKNNETAKLFWSRLSSIEKEQQSLPPDF